MNNLHKMLVVATFAGFVFPISTIQAQSSTIVIKPATPVAIMPPLPSSATKVLELSQGKVGDGTIIAYIKKSGKNYHLNADQILYLRKQGVSDAVITAMLNQPAPVATTAVKSASVTTTAVKPAPPPAVASTPAITPAPANAIPVYTPPTYVPVAPPAPYYYDPSYSYPAYYYPAYPFYPSVSLSFGWGGHWGGWHGGWHR